MPAFPKPSFTHAYDVRRETAALRRYRDTEPGRKIPAKRNNRLLLATWNIANLGVQKRRASDYRLIAEMISWFDLVALQEVNDDLSGLDAIMAQLRQHYAPADYLTVFSDRAGNNERTAFVYDSRKVGLLELVGEVAIPPKDHRFIRLPGVGRKFTGFDRNPYLAAFRAGRFEFMLVNVHLYYGDDTAADRARRSLETYAVGRWADLRRKSPNAYTSDIIALGDFNMPKAEAGDPIYKTLTKRGLRLPSHTSRVGSSLKGDKDYDQIAFFPGRTKQDFTGKTGVFDFDGAIFASLYQSRTKAQFRSYVRYYISDHRILWSEFRTG